MNIIKIILKALWLTFRDFFESVELIIRVIYNFLYDFFPVEVIVWAWIFLNIIVLGVLTERYELGWKIYPIALFSALVQLFIYTLIKNIRKLF